MSGGPPRELALIAALADNRVIGRDGALPWHLPDDLRRFRRLTTGHHVIMGRRTWESIGGPLPRRTSIVLSRSPGLRAEGALVVPDLDAALAAAEGDPLPFVIGGSAIYALALPRATRMYLTHVHAVVEGDALFPTFDESAWRLVEEEPHEAGEGNQFRYTFRTYERRRA